MLLNWTEHATPNVFSAAARAYTRLKLADHHRPIHSLVISNVPGPDFPLYLAGAEMVAGFPLGPVMDGAGLNITVMSYRGVLNWGLMACAETVPRLADLARLHPRRHRRAGLGRQARPDTRRRCGAGSSPAAPDSWHQCSAPRSRHADLGSEPATGSQGCARVDVRCESGWSAAG